VAHKCHPSPDSMDTTTASQKKHSYTTTTPQQEQHNFLKLWCSCFSCDAVAMSIESGEGWHLWATVYRGNSACNCFSSLLIADRGIKRQLNSVIFGTAISENNLRVWLWLCLSSHLRHAHTRLSVSDKLHFDDQQSSNKNLAIANRSRVSCAHNTSRAFIGLITPWP